MSIIILVKTTLRVNRRKNKERGVSKVNFDRRSTGTVTGTETPPGVLLRGPRPPRGREGLVVVPILGLSVSCVCLYDVNEDYRVHRDRPR